MSVHLKRCLVLGDAVLRGNAHTEGSIISSAGEMDALSIPHVRY